MAMMMSACLELAIVVRAVRVSSAMHTAYMSMMSMMMMMKTAAWLKVAAVVIRSVRIRMCAPSKSLCATSGMATERTAKVPRWAAATGGVVAAGVRGGGGVEVVVTGRGAVAVHGE